MVIGMHLVMSLCGREFTYAEVEAKVRRGVQAGHDF